MSFPPNRHWFNLHDIYFFIQSLPNRATSYWIYTVIIISSIDCPDFNTCHSALWAHWQLVKQSQASQIFRQSEHRSLQVHRHYACDPIVQHWDPTSIILPCVCWPAVPASSIFHYCVTVAASLSTPSLMYGLSHRAQCPKAKAENRDKQKKGHHHHLVV